MTNLNILEELRTRKEVEDYFKQLGKNITEEEIDALKQSYDKAEENNSALTLQQLDDVAGGMLRFFVMAKENADIDMQKTEPHIKAIGNTTFQLGSESMQKNCKYRFFADSFAGGYRWQESIGLLSIDFLGENSRRDPEINSMSSLRDKYPEAYNELQNLVLENPDLDLESINFKAFRFATISSSPYARDTHADDKLIPALREYFVSGKDPFCTTHYATVGR